MRRFFSPSFQTTISPSEKSVGFMSRSRRSRNLWISAAEAAVETLAPEETWSDSSSLISSLSFNSSIFAFLYVNRTSVVNTIRLHSIIWHVNEICRFSHILDAIPNQFDVSLASCCSLSERRERFIRLIASSFAFSNFFGKVGYAFRSRPLVNPSISTQQPFGKVISATLYLT